MKLFHPALVLAASLLFAFPASAQQPRPMQQGPGLEALRRRFDFDRDGRIGPAERAAARAWFQAAFGNGERGAPRGPRGQDARGGERRGDGARPQGPRPGAGQRPPPPPRAHPRPSPGEGRWARPIGPGSAGPQGPMRQQVREHLRQRFDRDGDGALSPDERQRAREQLGEHLRRRHEAAGREAFRGPPAPRSPQPVPGRPGPRRAH